MPVTKGGAKGGGGASATGGAKGSRGASASGGAKGGGSAGGGSSVLAPPKGGSSAGGFVPPKAGGGLPSTVGLPSGHFVPRPGKPQPVPKPGKGVAGSAPPGTYIAQPGDSGAHAVAPISDNAHFDRAYAFVLPQEGGFTADKDDTGNKLSGGRAGSTNHGATQANWEKFVGHQVTHDDMKALTGAALAPFYRQNYWNANQCDKFSPAMGFLVFDTAVNGGAGRAAQFLSMALGKGDPGKSGTVTPALVAAANAADQRKLASQFIAAKLQVYKTFGGAGGWAKYGNGWTNRANDSLKAALGMLDK